MSRCGSRMVVPPRRQVIAPADSSLVDSVVMVGRRTLRTREAVSWDRNSGRPARTVDSWISRVASLDLASCRRPQTLQDRDASVARWSSTSVASRRAGCASHASRRDWRENRRALPAVKAMDSRSAAVPVRAAASPTKVPGRARPTQVGRPKRLQNRAAAPVSMRKAWSGVTAATVARSTGSP